MTTLRAAALSFVLLSFLGGCAADRSRAGDPYTAALRDDDANDGKRDVKDIDTCPIFDMETVDIPAAPNNISVKAFVEDERLVIDTYSLFDSLHVDGFDVVLEDWPDGSFNSQGFPTRSRYSIGGYFINPHQRARGELNVEISEPPPTEIGDRLIFSLHGYFNDDDPLNTPPVVGTLHFTADVIVGDNDKVCSWADHTVWPFDP